MDVKCIYPECQEQHERIRILEVKQKAQEKINEEILETLKEIRKFILDSKERYGRDEQKLKTICDRIKSLESNQKWLLSGIITSLLTAVWHFFKKYL